MSKQQINTLQKIQAMVVSAKAGLAALKPSGLDDLDVIAQQRAVLREKLHLLTEAEAAELNRLEAAEREAEAKHLRNALLDVAKRAEAVEAKHKQLSIRADELLDQLIRVLVERDRLLNHDALGVHTLPFDHQEALGKHLLLWDSTKLCIPHLVNAWHWAVGKSCSQYERIRFANLYQGHGATLDGAPLPEISASLAHAARALATQVQAS